jgi:hypothetical protein
VSTEKLFAQVKAEAGEYIPAKLLEELLELRFEVNRIALNLRFGEYVGDRHRLYDDIMLMWYEIADVMITSEQNLGCSCGMEYLGEIYKIKIAKLEKHVADGTLKDGLNVLG